ncbi:MAG: RimK family alpha-L-glutamate ligase [Oscillospiraceae bacterium]|nr:RimK family alpha-L-glutamate ligase [Oscillospiraceae bacterium]
MKGGIVVNYFLATEKFRDIYSRLVTAFSEREVSLSLYTNSSLCHIHGEDIPFREKPDFVLFWDKDVSLARAIEEKGILCVNSADAIEKCDDKAKMHLALGDIPCPKTIIAPMTFPNIGFTDTSFLTSVAERLGFPIVVKEVCGSFGAQVYLARDFDELLKITTEHQSVPLLFQELIEESFGRDIRINVVGGRVCAAMLRESKNGDFRSNVTLGGGTLPYSPSDAECELALEAAKRLGLDFAGIDILFGKRGPLLCEVNSNAHFKSTYDCTGVDLAACIAEHIIKKAI